MNRKGATFAVMVMMIAMASFVALTPAYYVAQARVAGYRYHEWLAACAEATTSSPGFRQGYVYDEDSRLAAAGSGLNGSNVTIVVGSPTWNVYRYQATGVSECGNSDGRYVAKKAGLTVSEK